jgi:glutaredoxin
MIPSADTGDIKALLGRLTGHSTWPNVFIAGRHIGGSDDLQHVSTEGLLKGMLAEAGAFSRGAG